MSKAEEFAYSKYPKEKKGVLYDLARNSIIAGYHQAEIDLADKAKLSSGWDGFYYGQGYKQAEKGLELTWEDLATIEKLGDDLVKHNQTPMSDEEFYKEVLKRFKERKEPC